MAYIFRALVVVVVVGAEVRKYYDRSREVSAVVATTTESSEGKVRDFKAII